MKILLFLMLTLSLNTFAQWGASASLNSSDTSFDGTGVTATSSRGVGFSVGGFYDYEINDQFIFRGRLRYVSYTSKITDTGGTGDLNSTYIMINPTIIYKATPEFFITGGFQIGLNPNIEQEIDGLGITIDYDSQPNIDVNNLAMATLGVGYDFGQYQVALTYEAGLTPAAESTNSDLEVDISAINLGFNYLF